MDAEIEAALRAREQIRQLGLSRRVHGHAGGVGSRGQSPTYQSWRAMKARCLRPQSRDYPRYGGRGIGIDARWLGREGFVNFLADMGPRPEGLTIDRIDNDQGYGPGNCRWSTSAEQRHNRPQPRGWRQSYTPPKVWPSKEIICMDCEITAIVSSVVTRWRCETHRKAAKRANTARHRAKLKSSVRN